MPGHEPGTAVPVHAVGRSWDVDGLRPDHYFTSRPASRHRPGEFAVDLGGRRMTLATDAGVFSREGIDAGTRLLLKALTLPPGARRLVDLGCGYGPIGLALAGLAPEAEVYLLDPNERACELARANADRNRLGNVTVRQGEGLLPVDGRSTWWRPIRRSEREKKWYTA